mmetsp:Transcript_15235/g.26400  ORF Transcript_15235/g.26400 Transcript_15235/m.26400 type:complete len:187 (-) Transcript_15235:21-581(-)
MNQPSERRDQCLRYMASVSWSGLRWLEWLEGGWQFAIFTYLIVGMSRCDCMLTDALMVFTRDCVIACSRRGLGADYKILRRPCDKVQQGRQQAKAGGSQITGGIVRVSGGESAASQAASLAGGAQMQADPSTRGDVDARDLNELNVDGSLSPGCRVHEAIGVVMNGLLTCSPHVCVVLSGKPSTMM